jgi:superoxide dismutase, Cu-Zn family
LGNIEADANGIGSTSYFDHEITLYGARRIIGRSVVVHASVDDLGKGAGTSLVNGNAGGRLACGVIGIK